MHHHPFRFRRWIAAIGLVVAGPVPGADLPSLGSSVGGELSATQEQKLGERFLGQARKRLDFIQDPEVTSYVRAIGHRVAAQASFHAYSFRFYVVDDPALNAFAVPGGHIFVHSGLIRTAESADELAGVLAHEVAHLSQRHIARRMAAGKQTQLSSLLLVAAGVLAGASGQGEAAQALVTGAGAYSQDRMLSYSRDHEREADRLGIRYLSAAGYDPEALTSFLEKLQDWSQLQGRSAAPFLSTHPLTGNRVADARARAERMATEADNALGRPAFPRIQARLKALTADPPDKAYRSFREQVISDPKDTAARYGLALAAHRSGRPEEAINQLRRLVDNFPEEVAYRRALGRILLDSGHPVKAVAELERARERRPNDPALQEALGRALLAAGQEDRARRLLRALVRSHSERASAHEALARAYARLDEPIRAHRAEAEARWRQGRRTEALEQLRLARRLAKEQGADQLPLIRARLTELQPEDPTAAEAGSR